MPLKIVFNPDGSVKSRWWYGVYEVDGRRKVHNLGVQIAGRKIPHSLKELGDAAFEQSRIKAQVKLEQLVQEAHSRKSARSLVEKFYEMETGDRIKQVLIKDIADAWEAIPRRRKPHPRYVQANRTRLTNFANFMADKYPASTRLIQVNHGMAVAFMDAESERKLAAKSWNDVLKLLRTTFTHLQPETAAFHNPFGRIPTRETDTVFRQPFTPDELKDLLDNAKGDDFIRPIMVTAMCTAMRRGDCCLLKWADVNLKTNFIRVKTAKTGVTVEIPIFPLLRDELMRLPRGDSPFVFPEQAEVYKVNPDGITDRVRKVMAAAGFKDKADLKEGETSRGEISVLRDGGVRRSSIRDFHSFRVTWVTLALTAGVPLELVQRVTGHQTTDIVLKHYFQPGREDFRAALQSAMPRLLTNGQKSPKEEALGIIDTMMKKRRDSALTNLRQLVAAL